MRILKFLLALSLIATTGKTQDLITDRPDKTESCEAVPQGSLQIESGFHKEASSSLKSIDFSSTLFRYGLIKNLEIRIQADLVQDTYKDPIAYRTELGLRPMQLGFKYQFTEEKGAFPAISILSHITFNNLGSSDYINPQSYTLSIPTIVLLASHRLGEHWNTGLNLGYEADRLLTSSGINNNLSYTLSFGRSIAERVGFFAETFGDTETGLDVLGFDGGLTYLISDKLQIDAYGGFRTNTDSFAGFGISWRLDR